MPKRELKNNLKKNLACFLRNKNTFCKGKIQLKKLLKKALIRLNMRNQTSLMQSS